ncbi:MAG TPA: thiamine pyrophosphate-dependent enzyme [Candidatus Limnocylindria bacterium]|nr:thiamine pyrophosphate-dependent enzyme [Candidatus Limnocylindria bacterium]
MGIATAGAAVTAVTPNAAAADATPPPKLAPPSPILAAADTKPLPPVSADALHVFDPGSDYMVDVVKNLGVDFIAAMPGSTFRGIQESFVNYGGNTKPEWITVVHEEISAALAHGYAKVAGKPMAIIVHNTVGLQHASMALYNAWCDRVPILVLVGNIADAATRRPGVEWDHTATDVAQMVRGFVKYDDQPLSLDSFRESTTRAYALMTTPPQGAGLIVVDADLAESPVREKPAAIPPYRPVRPPVGDPAALDEVARLLVAATAPVIVANRVARTPAGMASLVTLAELLQAPVVDLAARMNFPTDHYLNQSFRRSVVAEADLVLNLENDELFGVVDDVPDLVQRHTVSRVKRSTKIVDINSELAVGAGNYQDKQRFVQADIAIAGEAEASLPMLIEAVQRRLTPERRAQNAERAQRYRAAFIARRMADRDAAAVAWDASPISVPRMCMEIWNQIRHEDWALVSQSQFIGSWPQRLWDITKHYQWIGSAGGGGVGYQGAAAVGAALAHNGTGRLVVNIVGDGELMVLPGSLWTLAHHRIPVLNVVHNNRSWHQEEMHVTRIADRRDRNPANGRVGTVIDDPAIDYAKMAESYGLYAEGPISSPHDLAPALARAIDAVKRGRPALIDVVSQGR